MGEAARRAALGIPPRGQIQRIQIQIDPEKDKPVACECSSTIFEPAIRVYKIPAVHPQNPTGAELITNQQVLVCRQCGRLLK